jgi:sugar phosphate isomerase/epimerase
MTPLDRRSFLAFSAMLPYAFTARAAATKIPVGLELYSVREELKKDPEATVRAVGEMGYQCVEFYAPYFERTDAQTKDMRKLLDNLGVRCFSTHNDLDYLDPNKINRTRDLNLTLGCKYVIVASAKPGPDGWMPVADALNAAAEKLEPSGLKVGYHNHEPEFRTVNGKRPAEFLAQHTKPSVVLQLDIGTCIAAGGDPVAWIRSQPGRIKSMHCKDWSPAPDKGYKVLFGEGAADWKNIFAAAESTGGLEYYLLEQEGSRYSELETAKRCLETFRTTHA